MRHPQRLAVRLLLTGSLILPLLMGPVAAQPVSPEELAFWQAVEQSGQPAEYQAYLDAYPSGRYADRARRLLGAGPSRPPAAPAVAAVPMAQGWVRPASAQVQLVQGVVLDMDATGLRAGSGHRLTVVPAGTPDEITDQARFLADSTPVGRGRLHLTIPAGPPGQDEVRLYYLPPYVSTFTVGARAPVSVGPGVPGATLARDLTREAQRLGPVRFETAHRDRPMLVQAAFLRVRPETEWNAAWFAGGSIAQVARQLVVISIGLPGALPDDNGSVGEVVCVLSAANKAALDRVAALNTGDPVLVRGTPYAWSERAGVDPLLLNRCTIEG